MVKPAIVRKAVLGLDVGKSAHWACLVTAEGEIAANRPVENSERETSTSCSRRWVFL